MAKRGWLRRTWRSLDGALVSISKTAKKILRTLRLLRAFLVLAVIVVLGSAIAGIVRPDWLQYAFAASVVFLVIPLVILLALVALPLQAKSVVRLIDVGYPANAKELAIRMAARKLHEQSIESEELLLSTAWNESKKLLRKYRQRAADVEARIDDLEEAVEAERARQNA